MTSACQQRFSMRFRRAQNFLSSTAISPLLTPYWHGDMPTLSLQRAAPLPRPSRCGAEGIRGISSCHRLASAVGSSLLSRSVRAGLVRGERTAIAWNNSRIFIRAGAALLPAYLARPTHAAGCLLRGIAVALQTPAPPQHIAAGACRSAHPRPLGDCNALGKNAGQAWRESLGWRSKSALAYHSMDERNCLLYLLSVMTAARCMLTLSAASGMETLVRGRLLALRWRAARMANGRRSSCGAKRTRASLP